MLIAGFAGPCADAFLATKASPEEDVAGRRSKLWTIKPPNRSPFGAEPRAWDRRAHPSNTGREMRHPTVPSGPLACASRRSSRGRGGVRMSLHIRHSCEVLETHSVG